MTSKQETIATEADMIARIRAIQPLLLEQARPNEENRSLTAEVDSALRSADAFAMLLPRRWGGLGFTMSAYCRVAIEVAKADLAASWVVQIINTTTWIASLASDRVQEALFGAGPALVCGVINPPGTVRKVAGGYRVSGSWPYSSGSLQADWMMAGCKMIDDDGAILPGMFIAYLPIDAVEIKPTWYVTGLQGTGSDTVVATDVVIPDNLLIGAAEFGGDRDDRKKYSGDASDYLPAMSVGRMTNLAQLLGGAQRMLELIEADVAKKPLIGTTYARKTDSGPIVHDLGEIATRLRTAELILFDAYRRFDERAAERGDWSELELAQSKADGAEVVLLIHGAIEQIMFIGGSSAFALANPLQRYWRDIHIALRHVLHVPQIGFEHYGRQRLSLKPDILPPGTL